MEKLEMILYELSGGDPLKREELKSIPLKIIYGYCYLNRVKELNLILNRTAFAARGKSE